MFKAGSMTGFGGLMDCSGSWQWKWLYDSTHVSKFASLSTQNKQILLL